MQIKAAFKRQAGSFLTGPGKSTAVSLSMRGGDVLPAGTLILVN